MKNPESIKSVWDSSPFAHANTAGLDRRRVLVIVEGTDDVNFFRSLLDKEGCNVTSVGGKDNVFGKVRVSRTNMVAIVDADYSPLTKVNYPFPSNVYATDTHDVETMIVSCQALDKVLRKWCDKQKIKIFEEKYGLKVISAITKIARPIGFLRWLSEEKNLNLHFDSIDIVDFIDQNSWALLANNLIEKVLINSIGASKRISYNSLVTEWESFCRRHKRVNDWLVCQGHDVAKVILVLLINHIGNKFMNSYNHHKVECELRGSYDYSYFRETELYNSLRNWEIKAKGKYRILAY